MKDLSADHRNNDISIIFSSFFDFSNFYAIFRRNAGGFKTLQETENTQKTKKHKTS